MRGLKQELRRHFRRCIQALGNVTNKSLVRTYLLTLISLVLSLLWISKSVFNLLATTSTVVDSSDASATSSVYFIHGSPIAIESTGSVGDMEQSVMTIQTPTSSSFVYPDTWTYEEPKCDPFDSEWHCGCKKFVLPDGSLQSGNIDYSLHKPRINGGIPRVVHFLSRMFTEEDTEDASWHKRKRDGEDRSWCGDVPCKVRDRYIDRYIDSVCV